MYHDKISSLSKNIIKILLLLSILSIQAMAIKENDIATQMKSKIDKTTNLLQNKKLSADDKINQIFETFDSVFDYMSMSRIALGSKWKKLSSEQKKLFEKTFTLKLKQSYIDKLNLYTNEKVKIERIEKIRKNRIKLHTKLIGQEEIYNIVYKFHKSKNSEWLIYDVEMIGVSIMKTYRNQFKEYLSTNSFDNLLTQLKIKTK